MAVSQRDGKTAGVAAWKRAKLPSVERAWDIVDRLDPAIRDLALLDVLGAAIRACDTQDTHELATIIRVWDARTSDDRPALGQPSSAGLPDTKQQRDVPAHLLHDPAFLGLWREVQRYERRFEMDWRTYLEQWRAGAIADDSWEKNYFASLCATVGEVLVGAGHSTHDGGGFFVQGHD